LYVFVFTTEVQVLTELFRVEVTSMSLDVREEELTTYILGFFISQALLFKHSSELMSL